MTKEEAFEAWISHDVRRSEMGADVDVWRDAFFSGYDAALDAIKFRYSETITASRDEELMKQLPEFIQGVHVLMR